MEKCIFQDDSDIFSLFHNIDYTLLLLPRLSGRGGGLGFFLKTYPPLPCISIPYNFSYSECLTISFTQKHKSISITIIYRPSKPEFVSFLSEFNDLATDLISSPTYHPIILGDFNYHVNAT